MRSPTSASLARQTQAPPWLLRLLTPLIARQVAAELGKQGLDPEQAAARMRADIGRPLSPDEERLVQAVVARLPTREEARETRTPASVWVLAAANLVPLAGVLFWGWDVFPLLVLFWMENVVIGVLNVLKMLLADPADAALWAGKLFLAPFFCFHYGMFTAIHGTFVFSLFGRHYGVSGLDVVDPALRAAGQLGLWLPLGVLVASHAFSFLWNYLYRGEFRRAKLGELMMKPYGRVVVLHLTILFGGFGAMALGSPLWALLLLVALKVGLDVRAHLKEHA